MDWITTSGSSIDEAKSNALDQLGIVADEAEFDIVNDVEKGLFGRIKSEAKIRARVRPKPPAAKEERRRRGGGGKNGKGAKQKRDSRGAKGKDGSGGGRARSGGNRGGGGRDERPKQQKSAQSRSDKQQKNAGQQRQPKQKASADRGGNERGGNERGADARGAEKSEHPDSKRNNVEHEYSREEQEQVAVGFLEGLVDVLDMSGTVALVEEEADDGAIELSVSGQELGLLVGPKGSTLNALQELTRTVVQREARGARTERLRVDVAGYRERRTAALQEFARGIADDVLESGTEKLLEPMGPADRKVVHDAVNELDGVETGSEGEEPRRRVVIRPTD